MVSFSLSAILMLTVPAASALQIGEKPLAAPEYIDLTPQPKRFAQITIERRIIIRVPRRPPATAMTDVVPMAEVRKLKERKIGNCLAMNNILSVQMLTDQSLDLITKDNKRIRAQLAKSCQTRSFYSGFYMEKSSDGRICADRDILHSRTGVKCEIEQFRELVPQR